MNTVEVLQTAKDWLIENKWAKYDGELLVLNSPNEACAQLALGHSGYTNLHTRNLAFYLLEDASHSRGFTATYLFNDHPDTTFNDVMDLYDEAILLAKQNQVDAA